MVPVGDKSIVDVAMDNWTPDQCAIFCNGLSAAEGWLEKGKEKMKERLKAAPDCIPGWTLGKGRVTEKITNAQTVFERFSASGGSLEQFMGCIAVGKTKLKEQLASVTKEKGKKLEATLSTLTAGCTEVKESEPSLKKVEAK
jgi:hypothetical protein